MTTIGIIGAAAALLLSGAPFGFVAILGVIALFAFRTAWNEFVTAQVFTMSNPGLKTLSVAVANLRYSANAAAEWHIMTAGASIALIPILIVYLLANRQFITGLTAGAVKG